MDVESYLRRIGCEDCLGPSPTRLFKLQREHLRRVPYESLDLLDGVAPGLSEDELFEKIVTRRRGGYCFELNGAFKALLTHLGYDVVQHFGRWLYGENLAMPPPRHRVLRVRFRGATFLADVGIGMWAPPEPLRFAYDTVQNAGGRDWRIVRDERLLNLVQVRCGESWVNYFSFGDDPAEDIDFLYVNQYLAKDPASPFRRGLLIHLPTAKGDRRITLACDPETGLPSWCYEVSQTDGSQQVRFLRTETDRAEVLKKDFGIVL